MPIAKIASVEDLRDMTALARELRQTYSASDRLLEAAAEGGLHLGVPVSLTVLKGGEDAPGEFAYWEEYGQEMAFVVWSVELESGRGRATAAIMCDIGRLGRMDNAEVDETWVDAARRYAIELWAKR
jgi:hypothetical protein